MIICSCFGLTDREIRAAYQPGGCGSSPAGSGCGGCRPAVVEIVERSTQQSARDARQPRDKAARDARR